MISEALLAQLQRVVEATTSDDASMLGELRSTVASVIASIKASPTTSGTLEQRRCVLQAAASLWVSSMETDSARLTRKFWYRGLPEGARMPFLQNKSLAEETTITACGASDVALPPLEVPATLQQAAVDLQWAILDAKTLPIDQQIKLVEQVLHTGQSWANQQRWEAADSALEHGMLLFDALSAAVHSEASGKSLQAQRDRAAAAAWGCLLLRLRAAVHLNQEVRCPIQYCE
jgi:hypothetical protein